MVKSPHLYALTALLLLISALLRAVFRCRPSKWLNSLGSNHPRRELKPSLTSR
jgi:hypothetical protein